MTLDAFLEKFASSLPHESLGALAIALGAGVVASAVCPCTVPVGLVVAGVVGSPAQTRAQAVGSPSPWLFSSASSSILRSSAPSRAV